MESVSAFTDFLFEEEIVSKNYFYEKKPNYVCKIFVENVFFKEGGD